MSRDFEAGVLRAILTQPRILRSFRRVIHDYQFRNPAVREVARLALGAISKDGEAPTRGELDHLIAREDAKATFALDMRDSIFKAVDSVWEADISGVTRDHVTRFITVAECNALAGEMTDLPEGEEDARLGQIVAKLQGLTSDVTGDALSFGRNFFGAGPEGLEKTVELAGKLYDTSYILPTGWRLFDQLMLGGFRPKEGNVVLGPTNSGKSELMIALGRVFNAHNKRVVLYGIDSTLEEMAERVVVSQSGVEIDANRLMADRKRDMLKMAPRHDLFVYREWAPGRMRVSDIRLHLQIVADILGPVDEAAGRPNPGHVDAILVDSPYLMVSENRSKEAHRFDLAAIYYDWIALLKDLDMVGIATHQSTRESMEKMSLGLQHVAEALAIVQPCANVFGLPTRTLAERLQRTRRVQFLKLRKPEGVGKEDVFIVNERRQLLFEDPDQESLGNMWRRGDDKAAHVAPPGPKVAPGDNPVDLSGLAALGGARRPPPPRMGTGPKFG